MTNSLPVASTSTHSLPPRVAEESGPHLAILQDHESLAERAIHVRFGSRMSLAQTLDAAVAPMPVSCGPTSPPLPTSGGRPRSSVGTRAFALRRLGSGRARRSARAMSLSRASSAGARPAVSRSTRARHWSGSPAEDGQAPVNCRIRR